MLLNGLLALLVVGLSTEAAWVGESYWSTLYYEGVLETTRTPDDFLYFKLSSDSSDEAFVGFWITSENGEHHESFGHVYVDSENRICGYFLAPKSTTESRKVCGGFRIFSMHQSTYASPFFFVSSRVAQDSDSVGYQRKQIARIRLTGSEHPNDWILGGVSLHQRTAYGIFANGTVLNIDDPNEYANRVEVLHIERTHREQKRALAIAKQIIKPVGHAPDNKPETADF